MKNTITVKLEIPFDTTQPMVNQIMQHINRFHDIEVPRMSDWKDSELEFIDKLDSIQLKPEPNPNLTGHHFTV